MGYHNKHSFIYVFYVIIAVIDSPILCSVSFQKNYMQNQQQS